MREAALERLWKQFNKVKMQSVDCFLDNSIPLKSMSCFCQKKTKQINKIKQKRRAILQIESKYIEQ